MSAVCISPFSLQPMSDKQERAYYLVALGICASVGLLLWVCCTWYRRKASTSLAVTVASPAASTCPSAATEQVNLFDPDPPPSYEDVLRQEEDRARRLQLEFHLRRVSIGHEDMNKET